MNPARVSETCAACHSDPSGFPAGLPTDQFAEWSESAHGVALHRPAQRAVGQLRFLPWIPFGPAPRGSGDPECVWKVPSAGEGGLFPGTPRRAGRQSTWRLGCHAPAVTRITRPTCRRCPRSGTSAWAATRRTLPRGSAGLELQEQIQRAEAAGERAREAVSAPDRSGRATSTTRRCGSSAVETHLKELLVQAHTLDPVVVDELVRRISSLATEIGERAESVEEHRWERKLLAIPFWILLLGGVLLALRKTASARRSRALILRGYGGRRGFVKGRKKVLILLLQGGVVLAVLGCGGHRGVPGVLGPAGVLQQLP